MNPTLRYQVLNLVIGQAAYHGDIYVYRSESALQLAVDGGSVRFSERPYAKSCAALFAYLEAREHRAPSLKLYDYVEEAKGKRK